MSVKLAFLATLEAKEGKGGELAEFLRAGRELAVTCLEVLVVGAGELIAVEVGVVLLIETHAAVH